MGDIILMNALISIKGSVFSENAAPDVIEVVTEGRYCTNGGKRYISYKESEMTGLEGVTTTLKVDGNDTVTLIRTGKSNSRLVISKRKRQLCRYETDYGSLMVGISGCHIDSRLNDKGGELFLYYTLDINSNQVSHNEIYISVREAKTQDVKSNKRSCQ